jgi:hypothetical protein
VPYLGRLRQDRDRIWDEVSRVLAPDGKAVLLGVCAEDEKPIRAAGLARRVRVRLSLSGRWTDVSVLSAENPGGTDPGC